MDAKSRQHRHLRKTRVAVPNLENRLYDGATLKRGVLVDAASIFLPRIRWNPDIQTAEVPWSALVIHEEFI